MSPQAIDRYPGARPFADDLIDQSLFFGRTDEIDMLFHRICAARLLVFFGKSGLGKTSLLQAGVFPKLRGRNMLPILVRLNINTPPLTIIETSANEACQKLERLTKVSDKIANSQGVDPEKLKIDYTPGVGTTLWEFFKTAMFWQGEVLLTPVLVFDQFEEIFTLKNAGERADLARELGDLFRGTLPQSVRQQRQSSESHASANSTLSEQPPNVRVILSLREDYLGALQELAADIPGIFDDRVRLSPLTKEQAEQAIRTPAGLSQDAASGGQFVTPPFAYGDDALTEILGYLRGKSEVIEPFQLQLVCRDIEQQVAQQQAKGAPIATITGKVLGGRKRLDKIVQNFYRQTLDKLPWRDRRYAQRLCEEGLLNAEGFRLPLQENEILKSYKLSEKALAALVDARLLRKEPRLESYFYELSHDSLAQPILDSRPLKLTRKQRNIAVGVVVILITLSLFGYWQFQAKREAEIAQERAQQAREAAEKVLDYLVFDLRDKLAPIGRLDIVEEVQRQVNQYYEQLGTEGLSPIVLNRRGAAYANEGDRLFDQGKLALAQQAYQKYLAIARHNTVIEPNESTWQESISAALNRLGNVSLAQGKLAEAQKYYQDSLALNQKLLASYPRNTNYQYNSAFALRKLAGLLYDLNKPTEAQRYYQDGLAIVRKLTTLEPINSRLQREEAALFSGLGDALKKQGKLIEAQQAYQEGFAIMQKFAAHDPGDTQWQSDLSLILIRLGDVLKDQGKLTEAQKYFQNSLSIRQKLADQDPSNTGWQRELSVTYLNLGFILEKQKKVSEAVEVYQKSLTIGERLADLDPNNATWQSDLNWVYNQLLPLLFELNHYKETAYITQRRIAHALKLGDSQANRQTLANDYLGLAWSELFNQNPKNAIDASEKGLKVNADELTNNTLNAYLAHGFLLSGQYQKAKELYLNHKDKKVPDGRSFKQAVLDDFKEFRKRGINHADMKKIEALLH